MYTSLITNEVIKYIHTYKGFQAIYAFFRNCLYIFAHFLSYDILLTYRSCLYVTDINPLMLVSNIFFLFVLKKKNLFIYLFGRTVSQLQHTRSSVGVCKVLVVACEIQFPDQRSNSGPRTGSTESQPLHHQGSPPICLLTLFFLLFQRVVKSTSVLLQVFWGSCAPWEALPYLNIIKTFFRIEVLVPLFPT